MSYRVHEEELSAVRDDAEALLTSTRDKPFPPGRYDWLYAKNPDGPAVLWSIRKEATRELVGFTVALPRRMIVAGRERQCWNGADFSMQPKFCTLGLAMKLRRAAKEGVDAGRADFLYAHPNGTMQIIHEKVGHAAIGTMVRYAKPLRVWPYLEKRLRPDGLPWMPSIVGRMIDGCYSLGSPEWRRRAATDVRHVAEPNFDDRFDQLFADLARERSIIGVRDGRYLRWRYAENPLYKTQAMLAFEAGRLAGYLLFTTEGETVHLKDLFAPTSGPIAADLVAGCITHARRARFTSLSAVLLEGHPAEVELARFGFRRRSETSQMFGYARERDPVRELVMARDQWLAAVGDRDV